MGRGGGRGPPRTCETHLRVRKVTTDHDEGWGFKYRREGWGALKAFGREASWGLLRSVGDRATSLKGVVNRVTLINLPISVTRQITDAMDTIEGGNRSGWVGISKGRTVFNRIRNVSRNTSTVSYPDLTPAEESLVYLQLVDDTVRDRVRDP